MIGVIIVLGILLVVAAALIFCLLKVLKNTFKMVAGLSDLVNGKMPRNIRKAYNDKYYPAIVIAKISFGCKQEGKIVDFSLYEKYKIVGITVMTKDAMSDYYGTEFLEELDEETLEDLAKPVIIKNALVYEVAEGDWLWKSAE
jgi:hypothetical protein